MWAESVSQRGLLPVLHEASPRARTDLNPVADDSHPVLSYLTHVNKSV